MTASADAAREYLTNLRPDVLRVAAGIMANPNLSGVVKDHLAGRGVDDNADAAAVVADLALAIVKAVDRATGAEPEPDPEPEP